MVYEHIYMQSRKMVQMDRFVAGIETRKEIIDVWTQGRRGQDELGEWD